MNLDKAIVHFVDHVNREEMDLELALDMTAFELFTGLNVAQAWGYNPADTDGHYLVMERPIALLKGNKSLGSFGVRDGSIIHFKRQSVPNERGAYGA